MKKIFFLLVILFTISAYSQSGVIESPKIPNQTGNTGKYLKTNGSKMSWATVTSGLTTSLTASTNIVINGTAPNYTISTPTQTTGLASTLNPTITSPTFSTATTYSYATVNSVPYFNASKGLVSSTITPTTLGYLDATSSVQNQLDVKYTTWRHSYLSQINPSDVTFYYFAIPNVVASSSANNTTNYLKDLACPKTGTIVACVISQYCTNAASTSTETSTLYLRNSSTSSNSTLTSTYTFNYATAVKSTTITGLNISVVQGQLMETIIGSTTWVTNPLGVMLTIDYLIK